MKVVIVGGVAGGATAAARIRRLDEQAEIIVFERSSYISYANCGLPYYIGDVITDADDLTLQTPESFWKRFRIAMKVHHEVTAIHPERKAVTVRNLETGAVFDECYDKLLLSPGAQPTQPKLPGMGIGKLFTLRTVEDTFRIKEYIDKNHPKSVVLAGGGFIGLELAENLRELGMDVTIVQRPKQLMNPFDADMASFIHNEVRKAGIHLSLGQTVEGFQERNGGVDVLLRDSAPLHADMVILAIGVTPESKLAKDAGLTLGIKGSILVNDRMETSVPGVYAIGDVNGHHMLAHTAYREAEVAVNGILGKQDTMRYHANPSVIYTQPEIASVGKTEEECKEKGIDYEVAKLPMLYSGRFVAENEGADGLCKIIIDRKRRTILGVHLLGSYSGEIIWGAAQMLEMQLRVQDARQIIFPHPTVSEIIRETLWEFHD